MTRWWLLWGLALLVGATACADTLHLKTGQAVAGELYGVTAVSVVWRGADGRVLTFPLDVVARVQFTTDPTVAPRVNEAEWRKAMGRAQRDLVSCRTARHGLFIGGLAFLGGGYWLSTRGYAAGNILAALGAVAAGLGLIAPSPPCAVFEDRVMALTRIGLDHGWLH